jgi:hypothetical protein
MKIAELKQICNRPDVVEVSYCPPLFVVVENQVSRAVLFSIICLNGDVAITSYHTCPYNVALAIASLGNFDLKMNPQIASVWLDLK